MLSSNRHCLRGLNAIVLASVRSDVVGKFGSILGRDGEVSRKHFLDVIQYGGLSNVGLVVFLTQVGQHNTASVLSANFGQKLAGLVVGQVASWT